MPESEAELDEQRAALQAAIDANSECWGDLASSCFDVTKRADIKIKAKRVSVLVSMHAKQVQSVKLPRKMDVSAPAHDAHETQDLHVASDEHHGHKKHSRGKRSRPDDLLYALYDPSQEDVDFSLKICEKKMAILRFYHKSLRMKIDFCNQSRIAFDTIADFNVLATQALQESLDECRNTTC
jgi:hypothetical protein